MADLNLDINYFEHIKTRRLVEALGKGSDVLPLRLFCYAAKHYARDGKLAGHDAEEIERAIDWWGESGECAAALVKTHFLDLQKGVYRVHNFTKRSGHLASFAVRASKAARTRWKLERERKDRMLEQSLSSAQASASNAPTQPTQPTVLPNPPDPPTGAASHGSGRTSGGPVNGSGPGSGSGGNLGAAMARENGAIEKIVGIKRLLVAAGVNETIHGEFTSRRDLNETIVTNEIEDIKRDPKAELPAVLVSRLRKKRYQ
jgi:hypothetical protein